jgi:hypothetical protein
MKEYQGVEIKPNSFLISEVDGDELHTPTQGNDSPKPTE